MRHDIFEHFPSKHFSRRFQFYMTMPYVPCPNSFPVGLAFLAYGFNFIGMSYE